MSKLVFALAVLALVGSQLWVDREIRHPPGEIAPDDPRQTQLRDPQPVFIGGYRLTPLAAFEIEARVLATESYWFGREADLSPIDLALGWGPMSAQEVLDRIEIRQSGRFYFWHTSEFPIPRNAIETHSANMHLIPASDAVAAELGAIRAGHVVDLEGSLVRIDAEDGWTWLSSLTREDTGNGACELFLVERVRVR